MCAGTNHPSIVIRSIGNELGQSGPQEETPRKARQGKMLADRVRAIDPTRPVAQGGGSNLSEHDMFTGRVGFGPLADAYTDIADARYIQDVIPYLRDNPRKALIQSESHIASMYTYWKLATDHDQVAGDFSWAGWDYLGEAGIGAPGLGPDRADTRAVTVEGQSPGDALSLAQVILATYPWYGAGCGDHDHIGRPRPQRLYRRVVWA